MERERQGSPPLTPVFLDVGNKDEGIAKHCLCCAVRTSSHHHIGKKSLTCSTLVSVTVALLGETRTFFLFRKEGNRVAGSGIAVAPTPYFPFFFFLSVFSSPQSTAPSPPPMEERVFFYLAARKRRLRLFDSWLQQPVALSRNWKE